MMDMSNWIVLLRGINVGGKNLLPMRELVSDLRSLNLEGVKTYLQSGNVVFRSFGSPSEELTSRIAQTIEERHGFRPIVFVFSADQWQRAIESNPFPEAEAVPKTLHLFFLSSIPTKADFSALTEVQSASERFRLEGRVFYLHAPDGMGRSKVAANVEKFLGVAATARNWRTVRKLSEMVRAG